MAASMKRRRMMRRFEEEEPLWAEVPESESFKELVELEKRIDALIQRKRVQMVDALAQPVKVKKQLRLFISNTIAMQNHERDECTWNLRVEGKLVDENKFYNRKKMSELINKVFIELDNDRDNVFEWSQSAHDQVECDGFEISRDGVDQVEAKLLLYIDHHPSKFKLAKSLSKVLSIHTATKATVIEELWKYIKKEKLQDPQVPETFWPDKYLTAVFNKTKAIQFSDLPSEVDALLIPAEPIKIDYVFDPKEPKRILYDVELEMNEDQQKQFDIEPSTSKDVNELDSKIANLTEQISNARKKREFMLTFATDPKEFIVAWTASQEQDAKGSELHGGLTQEERTAGHYTSRSKQEAIYRYNYTKLNSHKEQLEKKREEQEIKLKARMMPGMGS